MRNAEVGGESVSRESVVVTGSRSQTAPAHTDASRARATCRTVFVVGRRTRRAMEICFVESRPSVRPDGVGPGETVH